MGRRQGTARRYDVYTVVAGILTAALNDEFQEEVYANPDWTVEQLNELYASLAAEYGLVVDSPYFDMDSFSKGWFTTNQYFDSPFLRHRLRPVRLRGDAVFADGAAGLRRVAKDL